MNKGVDGFFDDFLKKEPLFKDKAVLQANYNPNNIPHREEHIEKVAGMLAPALRIEKPSNMFIYGKTGCIVGDSLVYTNQGYKKIKDLSGNEKVLSYNFKKKYYEWKEFIFLEYENKDKLFKIDFYNGLSLKLTKDHPLLLKSLDWKKADELKKGDSVSFAFNFHWFDVKHKYDIPIEFARLLGSVISNGSMGIRKRRIKDSRGYWYNSTKKRLRISCADEYLLNMMSNDLKVTFPEFKALTVMGHTCKEVMSVSQTVCNYFNNYDVPFGKKSHIVKVPECIFQGSQLIQKEFLNALFSGDGFVSKNIQMIEYYSNSKELLNGVQLLLFKFGIKSRVMLKKAKCNGKLFDSFRLYITEGNNLLNFQKLIGFYHPKRSKRLNNMLNNYKFDLKENKEILISSKIVNIEEVYEEKVYDLQVPVNNNFIANGVISHNSGKTLVVKHVVESMEKIAEKNNLPIKIFYLNCKMKRVADTEYRLIAELARALGVEIPATGLPTDEVYRIFIENLEKKKVLLILILDEIDQLVSRAGDQVLYSLTRFNSELKNSLISIVGISNDLMFTNYLDPRVKSSLSEEELVFPPYNAIQLQAILKDRAEKAFQKGVVVEGLLEKCAAYAAREHGDARRALELLRVAGELAERNNCKQISIDILDEAEEKVERDRVHDIILSQPKQSQITLLAIFEAVKQIGNKPLFTGDVYELYKELCHKVKIKPLTQRRISDLVAELDMLGIIHAKVISKGRYGRTRQFGLGVPPSTVPKLEKLLKEGLNV